MVSQDRLLTAKEAAARLQIAPQTLALWRCTGRYKLPFVKIGRRVRYRESDLDQFVANGTMLHTGEEN